MSYIPSLYNPYGSYYQSAQPIDGLVWIDGIEGAQMYPLPPNSTSPPLLWKNEARFSVKKTDGGGAFTIETYDFTKAEIESKEADNSSFVTKADLESFKRDIMEAINGQSAVSE